MLDYLQVEPQQVIFLDDNPENITGAAQLGLATILVASHEQVVAKLREMGVLS